MIEQGNKANKIIANNVHHKDYINKIRTVIYQKGTIENCDKIIENENII